MDSIANFLKVGPDPSKVKMRLDQLKRFMKPRGCHTCYCGRTISLNKNVCFNCSQKKVA